MAAKKVCEEKRGVTLGNKQSNVEFIAKKSELKQ